MHIRTLAFWKWRLKRDGGEDEVPSKPARRAGKRIAFVELAPTEPVVSPMSETRVAPIEVVPPVGYRARIAPSFERSALVELLDPTSSSALPVRCQPRGSPNGYDVVAPSTPARIVC